MSLGTLSKLTSIIFPQDGDSVFPSSLNRVLFGLSLEGTVVLHSIALGSCGVLGGHFFQSVCVDRHLSTCFLSFPFLHTHETATAGVILNLGTWLEGEPQLFKIKICIVPCWMDFENIMLREINQMQKGKCSHPEFVRFLEPPGFIETSSRVVIARVWGEGSVAVFKRTSWSLG